MHHGLRRVALLAAIAGLAALPGTASADVTRCNGLPVTIRGTEGPDPIVGTSGRDVIAALGGNDRVSAGPGNDVVCLGDGNDALNGGAGDDLLVADDVADGADGFAGGTGTDTVRYAGRTASLAVSLDNEPDDGARDEDDNIHADVENVTGGRGSNTLRGSAAANSLLGGDALDVIEGGSGHDVLRGGPADDIIVPGLGDDTATGGDGNDRLVAESGIDGADVYAGGSGRDTVAYAGRATAIRVFLDGAANDGSLPFGEGDNIGGPANDVENVIGGSGADTFNVRAFFGGARLEGGAGDDGFTTTNGVVDTVDGGLGADRCQSDPVDVVVSCG
jgi:Ca2+-binding RTX toxin-like protein